MVIEWCLCTLENVDFIGFIIIVVRGGGGEGGELVDRLSIVRSFVRSFVRRSFVNRCTLHASRNPTLLRTTAYFIFGDFLQ